MRWLLFLILLSTAACKTVQSASSASDCQSVGSALAADGFEVYFEHYLPSGQTDRAVIIMPPTGGSTFLESRYAALFCNAGFAVYVVREWTGMSETSIELAVHSRLFGRAQRALRLLAEASPHGFVGLLGTSVGGLHAATAAGHLERISAAFVIAAGAPVADVIAYTDQGALASVRERRMHRFGFEDQAEYRDALAREFAWEPLDFLSSAREKPLGMVVVRGDKTVPTPMQEQLRDAWQPVADYTVAGFPLGAHAVGIFQAWWLHRRDILAFFSRHAATRAGSAI